MSEQIFKATVHGTPNVLLIRAGTGFATVGHFIPAALPVLAVSWIRESEVTNLRSGGRAGTAGRA